MQRPHPPTHPKDHAALVPRNGRAVYGRGLGGTHTLRGGRCAARLTLILVAAMALAACRAQPWTGFPPADAGAPAWSAAPERARIAYVGAIHDYGDLFPSRGFWQAFSALVAGSPDSRIGRPSALALHPDGGLLVADTARRRVHFFDWARQRYVVIGPARPRGGLPSPVGVAALPDGRILVSDSRLGSVEAFGSNGRWLGTFVETDTVERPAGLAVSVPRQEIYLVDVKGHAIAVFDFEGRLLRRMGRRGAEPGELNYPTHVALTPEGRLAVTDSMNFRVQVLDPDGVCMRLIGRMGKAPGQFSKPKGVAVDGAGRIVVVEGLYDALEFFDSEGHFLLHVGGSGSGPGEFWLPSGLACDAAEGLLFVADSYNARVQVFRLLEEPAP